MAASPQEILTKKRSKEFPGRQRRNPHDDAMEETYRASSPNWRQRTADGSKDICKMKKYK